MSDKLKKEVGKLHRQLVQKQTELNHVERSKIRKVKDLDCVGNNKAPKKEIPGSKDIPDVVLMPKKQKRTENKW